MRPLQNGRIRGAITNGDNPMRKSTKLSRRGMMAGLPAIAAGVAPAVAFAADDPIFQAIEEHRKAYDAWQATPDEIYGEEANMAAMGTEGRAMRTVLTTHPTTPAGVAALLTWLAQPEWFDHGEPRIRAIGEYDTEYGRAAARQMQAAAAVLREARS